MFSDKCIGFRLNLVNEFTNIVPSNFEDFIGHHQVLFACFKTVLYIYIYIYIYKLKLTEFTLEISTLF